jgi:hypothetical protein
MLLYGRNRLIQGILTIKGMSLRLLSYLYMVLNIYTGIKI